MGLLRTVLNSLGLSQLSELTAAQKLNEELKFENKRNLVLMGVGAVLVWLYVKRKPEIKECDLDEVRSELEMRPVDSAVPASLHCVICMEGTKEVMMEPCGHVCCCRKCASMLSNKGEIRCMSCLQGEGRC
eukprot:GFUD01059562.1.p1 GENE.GFUD01059562.1~~GFUD01059562.1.p1  ORF type:complete len:131 (-),score=32.94 GFUD01059562.1:138-530(-)